MPVSSDVVVPGGRDVRGSLDHAHQPSSDRAREPPSESSPPPADGCVVACPPHPQHRGHRGDARLTAVSAALTDRGVDCLRIDYGAWDEGRGERTDVDRALGWARERYANVGLFGFSFGATLALLAAGDGRATHRPDAVAALAPTAQLSASLDAVAVVDEIATRDLPARIVYGTRDDTADWRPVIDRATTVGIETVELAADHFFVGQQQKVADRAGPWLADQLGG